MHRIAESVGCLVDDLRQTITHKAFINWVAYFKRKDEKFEKWEWYAAQIPWIIAQVNGNDLKMSEFTMKHSTPVKASPKALLQMIAVATGATIEEYDG